LRSISVISTLFGRLAGVWRRGGVGATAFIGRGPITQSEINIVVTEKLSYKISDIELPLPARKASELPPRTAPVPPLPVRRKPGAAVFLAVAPSTL